MPDDPFAMPTTVNSVERSTPATRRGRCNQAYAAPPLQPNSASGSCCADLIRASTSLFRPPQSVDGRARPTTVRFRFLPQLQQDRRVTPQPAVPVTPSSPPGPSPCGLLLRAAC